MHAAERLEERTTLHPDTVPLLEAEADRVSGQLLPGKYYLPLNDAVGNRTGYAAFKTVPSYPSHKLVLATILGPNMKPKGESLSHLMMQPRIRGSRDANEFFGLKTADAGPDEKKEESAFGRLKNKVTEISNKPGVIKARKAVGGYLGTNVMNQASTIPLSLMLGPEEGRPPPADAIKQMKRDMNVPGRVAWNPKGRMARTGNTGNASYTPPDIPTITPAGNISNVRRKGGLIDIAPNTQEAIMAHEMGHAKNWQTLHSKLRAAYHPALYGSAGMRMLASKLQPINTAIAAATDEPDWRSSLVQGGLMAPTLLDEGLASSHAVKYLIGKHGLGAGLRKSLPLGAAFGTYGMLAGSPALVTGARKYLKYRREKGKPSDAKDE